MPKSIMLRCHVGGLPHEKGKPRTPGKREIKSDPESDLFLFEVTCSLWKVVTFKYSLRLNKDKGN